MPRAIELGCEQGGVLAENGEGQIKCAQNS